MIEVESLAKRGLIGTSSSNFERAQQVLEEARRNDDLMGNVKSIRNMNVDASPIRTSQNRSESKKHSDTLGTELQDALLSDVHYARYLLSSKQYDVNWKDASSHNSLLHILSYSNLVHSVQLLLMHGASVNAVNKNGESALHWCAAQNSVAAAKALLDRGADSLSKDNSGSTALMRAAACGHPECVSLLLHYDVGDSAEIRAAAGLCTDMDERSPLQVSQTLLGEKFSNGGALATTLLLQRYVETRGVGSSMDAIEHIDSTIRVAPNLAPTRVPSRNINSIRSLIARAQDAAKIKRSRGTGRLVASASLPALDSAMPVESGPLIAQGSSTQVIARSIQKQYAPQSRFISRSQLSVDLPEGIIPASTPSTLPQPALLVHGRKPSSAKQRPKIVAAAPIKALTVFLRNTSQQRFLNTYAPAPLEALPLQPSSSELLDVIVCIEHCCDCENHSVHVWHDGKRYRNLADRILVDINKALLGSSLPIRLFACKSKPLTHSRLGALEVTVSVKAADSLLPNTKNAASDMDQVDGLSESGWLSYSAHSKLSNGMWPNATKVCRDTVGFVTTAVEAVLRAVSSQGLALKCDRVSDMATGSLWQWMARLQRSSVIASPEEAKSIAVASTASRLIDECIQAAVAKSPSRGSYSKPHISDTWRLRVQNEGPFLLRPNHSLEEEDIKALEQASLNHFIVFDNRAALGANELHHLELSGGLRCVAGKSSGAWDSWANSFALSKSASSVAKFASSGAALLATKVVSCVIDQRAASFTQHRTAVPHGDWHDYPDQDNRSIESASASESIFAGLILNDKGGTAPGIGLMIDTQQLEESHDDSLGKSLQYSP